MDDQKPTDGTVADLKDHVETVDDPAHLEQLRAEEEAGKNRAGALAAIDARAAALNKSGTVDTDQNVTGTEGDSSANATHDDGGALATTLVETPHPDALTDDQINEASGGGLNPGASPQQRDVAQQLVEAREDAQADEPVERDRHPLFGYGPGADVG